MKGTSLFNLTVLNFIKHLEAFYHDRAIEFKINNPFTDNLAGRQNETFRQLSRILAVLFFSMLCKFFGI